MLINTQKTKPNVVVSKADLLAALNHLNNLPYTATNSMPEQWGAQQVKDWMISDIPAKFKVGDSFEFGSGLWGHIKPLGYEFANYENPEHTIQIVVSIRQVHTDLNRGMIISGV
jgi:hypothetical protein